MAKPGREDTWELTPIGDNPFRVGEDTNQFVACLLSKKIWGRAWNEGGVLECSFPYYNKELTAKDLYDEEILILTYSGDFYANNFLYKWVPYKERHKDIYQLVFCGCRDVCPALMWTKDGVLKAGQINMKTEIASASYDNQAEQFTGEAVQDMLVLVRNLKEPPRTPPCPHESDELPPLEDDGWVNLRVKKHKLPECAVLALGRPLKTEDGSEQAQAVALWYKDGEPVMAAYNNGHLVATFGWEGKEFSGDMGAIQVQCYHSKEFEISWRPFKDRESEGWTPVHVKDCAPCAITTPSGAERLGKVLMSQQKASVAWGKKEEIYTGPEVKEFMVLCRKPPLSL